MARRPGIQQAIPAVKVTKPAAIQTCSGFPNSKPGRKLLRERIAISAIPSPIARPIATLKKPQKPASWKLLPSRNRASRILVADCRISHSGISLKELPAAGDRSKKYSDPSQNQRLTTKTTLRETVAQHLPRDNKM